MRPLVENAENELPGTYVRPRAENDKMSFQGYFWPYLRPGAENVQNELPGATFGCVCGQGLKMLKISFMGLLLTICAAIG